MFGGFSVNHENFACKFLKFCYQDGASRIPLQEGCILGSKPQKFFLHYE